MEFNTDDLHTIEKLIAFYRNLAIEIDNSDQLLPAAKDKRIARCAYVIDSLSRHKSAIEDPALAKVCEPLRPIYDR